MKRLIMLALPLLLMIGISNAQTNEWQTETLKYTYDTGTAWAVTVATQSDTAMMDSTFYSNSIELPEYIVDPLDVSVSRAGVATYNTGGSARKEKFPSKLSIRTTATEYNVGDSLYVINTLQLSDDNVVWDDFSPIDTLISIADAGSRVTEYQIFTDFPEVRYARVKHLFTTAGNDILDTLFHSGALGKSFTE